MRSDELRGGTLVRENIIAQFAGQPSLAEGGQLVMLEVHQDTVPIDGMTIDPFGGQIEGGRLTGRGACDIKGGMACLLSAAHQLMSHDGQRPTVVIACAINEEFGFCGAKHLAELLSSGGDEIVPRLPDAIIVTEPTDLNVVSCHKGMIRWVCETIGQAAHSSNPANGQNAIYRMAPVITSLAQFANELQDSSSNTMTGKPTLSVGTIQGGISVNTVPDHCRIEIDRRLLPEEDPLEARARIVAASGANACDYILHHHVSIQSPGLTNQNNEALSQALVEVASNHSPNRKVIGVPYGTDAAFLANCGAPTVVFGPGSIDQAHTKDEWVELQQLELATAVLRDFLISLSAAS